MDRGWYEIGGVGVRNILRGLDRSRPRYVDEKTDRLSLGLTHLSTQGYAVFMAVDFGSILRQLRAKKGVSIKRLAPDLGVTYTYLSKLENNEAGPSEQFVDRVAHYFDYDRDELLLSAGKVPQEVLEILRTHPQDAVEFLRERFGKRRDGPSS